MGGPSRYENWLSALVLLLLVPYVCVAFTYPVIELESPFLHIFLPLCVLFGAVTTIAAFMSKQPALELLRFGLLLGFASSLLLFLSNFAFSERFEGTYVVTNVSEGKGRAYNWLIDTPERKNVRLYVNFDGIGFNRARGKLALYKGWLGYYYGKGT